MMIVIYVIAAFVLLIFGLQLTMIISAKKSKGKRITGLNGKLKALERNGSKGLIYFFSPTCRTCKYQTPIIKELQAKNRNVFDIDISKDMQTARVFGIKATPTTVLIENGTVKEVLLGVKQKADLKAYLH